MIRLVAVFTFLLIVGVCSFVVLNPGSYSTPVQCLASFALCVAILTVAHYAEVEFTMKTDKRSGSTIRKTIKGQVSNRRSFRAIRQHRQRTYRLNGPSLHLSLGRDLDESISIPRFNNAGEPRVTLPVSKLNAESQTVTPSVSS